ncbi:MAG: hypothetical protein AAGJ35_01250 [Myxococcota bacterium]
MSLISPSSLPAFPSFLHSIHRLCAGMSLLAVWMVFVGCQPAIRNSFARKALRACPAQVQDICRRFTNASDVAYCTREVRLRCMIQHRCSSQCQERADYAQQRCLFQCRQREDMRVRAHMLQRRQKQCVQQTTKNCLERAKRHSYRQYEQRFLASK